MRLPFTAGVWSKCGFREWHRGGFRRATVAVARVGVDIDVHSYAQNGERRPYTTWRSRYALGFKPPMCPLLTAAIRLIIRAGFDKIATMINYVDQISVEDYNGLRKAVGWAELERKQAETGIKNSVFFVAAVSEDRTVGMARIVGDGGYIAYIADVIVLPEFQGNGIGKALMQKCIGFLKESLQEGQQYFVNLVASPGKEPFYEKFGFNVRPNEKEGAGMTQRIYFDAAGRNR